MAPPKFDTPDAQNAAKGGTEAGVKYLEQQGRTSQDIQAYIRDLHENNPAQYRQTIDAVFNRVHQDARQDSSLNGLLPQIDLTDNAVDPAGAANDRASFKGNDAIPGVQTNELGQATGYGGTAQDGKSGMFMDAAGHTTGFAAGDQGVQVTSTGVDGSVNTFNHTDVDPKSVKLDPNTGELTMNRTGLGDGQTGTVTVHPGGAETTSIKNKDNTVTTIDRTQAGGEITNYHSNSPATAGIHCENGKWSGLPGQTGDKQPQNVHVEANGQVSYDLDGKNITAYTNGVTKTTEGNTTVYRDGDKTLRYDGTDWYANRDGSSEIVKVSAPWMDNNGNLRATVGAGAWADKDKDFVLGGGQPTDGHENGWTYNKA